LLNDLKNNININIDNNHVKILYEVLTILKSFLLSLSIIEYNIDENMIKTIYDIYIEIEKEYKFL
jgi:hypothetical protein